MKQERVIELFEEAQHEAGDMHAVFRFAQMIEQETLEMASEKLATQHTWITSLAASKLVLALKETRDL